MPRVLTQIKIHGVILCTLSVLCSDKIVDKVEESGLEGADIP